MRDYREVTKDAVTALARTSGLIEEYVAIIRDQNRVIAEQANEIDSLYDSLHQRKAQDAAENVMDQALKSVGL